MNNLTHKNLYEAPQSESLEIRSVSSVLQGSPGGNNPTENTQIPVTETDDNP